MIFFILAGCNVKKNLQEGQYLTNKYRITLNGKHSEISTSEIRTLMKPDPNTKFLMTRFKLWTHYKYQKKQSKFNTWLNKHFSEEPVFYNEHDTKVISKKIERYLNNIGYINSDVKCDVTLKNKVANIRFIINPATPYRIKELNYEIPDSLLRSFVINNKNDAHLKKGDIYNAYTFDDERDRITRILRDNGYYYFNRNYIQYLVDSNFRDHKMDVDLVINNVKTPNPNNPGESIEKNHLRYIINNIYIIPEYDPSNLKPYDTIVHPIEFWKDANNYKYYFLYNSHQHLLPSAFNTAIKIKPSEPYSMSSVQATYRKLFNYQIIQTANISFDSVKGKTDNGNRYLDARIRLKDSELNRFSAEVEGTNSSGDLGIRGNLIFLNKNIFKRAEVLRVRLKGGVEAQSVSETPDNPTGLFNTFEAGIDGTVFFPRFLSPIRLNKFNQRYIPNTNINFGFNYQNRPNYSRNITNLDIGYNWTVKNTMNHILTPININYVNINPTQKFDSILQNEPNRRLREQYSDHMIVGLKYSFIFNNQNLLAHSHFNYFRINIETSGNLLNGIKSLSNAPLSDSGYYQVLGVRYSQYIRTSLDFRHYFFFLHNSNSLVFRTLIGLGIPYGNSDELPYEKGFYAGGANDMRGWLFKELGPGGFSGSTSYERIGDIQLEANIEYRFPIYSFFKGAFFVDVGNIWTYNESSTFPGGDFYFNKFVSQLAVDAGFGLRFDFKVFIFRIDVAAPMRNPAYPSGERWRIGYIQPVDFVWNFGIGYPF